MVDRELEASEGHRAESMRIIRTKRIESFKKEIMSAVKIINEKCPLGLS